MVYPKTGSVIVRHGREMTYTHIQANQTPSRSVCFFFPGASYSFDRPYLYYSTMLFLSKQFDLVHVHAQGTSFFPFVSDPVDSVAEGGFGRGKLACAGAKCLSRLSRLRYCRSPLLSACSLLWMNLVVFWTSR